MLVTLCYVYDCIYVRSYIRMHAGLNYCMVSSTDHKLVIITLHSYVYQLIILQ